MSESLKEWAKEREEMLEFVASHGRSKTIRSQARALLEITDLKGESSEQ
ncbi:MAG: hypothetical protein ACLFVL_00370 [Candidatus Aenigmatarchaeota archaeon]